MTDVEKRAHDLAIACVTGKIAANTSSIDAFNLYMEAYNQALKEFEKAFPAQK